MNKEQALEILETAFEELIKRRVVGGDYEEQALEFIKSTLDRMIETPAQPKWENVGKIIPNQVIQTPAPNEKVDDDYHKLCAQCWDALGITEYTGKHIVEHIRDLVEQNQTYKNRFNIGDIVQVSPNCEYFEDWKGEKLEIVGVYRAKPIGYSTPNDIPPIKYSVKDIKDNWNYGFTDDFDGDDLLLATQED